MNTVIPSREELIQLQKDNRFDVIVIGGGATGAGVARDAALRGLKVALVEKGDFSSGTSSQSTKLLHGGLRYLKNYEFGLVREAALERKTNLEIAPHLGEIRDFLVPLYKWSEDRPILLRMGLWVYDLLSFPKNLGRHRWLNKKQLVEREPLLDNEDLKSGGMYQDVRSHDSRLVMANMLSAITLGAAATNYTEANMWTFHDEGVNVNVTDLETGKEYIIDAKVLLNCTGPWIERVEDKIKDYHGKAELRPTWGAHLWLKKKTAGYPLLIVNEDGRAVFLIPQEDYDMAGTTDIDYKGDPDKIAPTAYDRDYILKAVNKLFPKAMYSKDDVVSAFSGLRPLVAEKGVAEGKVSRNHEIFIDKQNNVITVAGGKLTTYRIMAKEAVDKAVKLLGLRKRDYPCRTNKVHLFGGEIELDKWEQYLNSNTASLVADYQLDEKTAKKMIKHYGSEIPRFREIMDEHGSDKFAIDRPWLEAQVLFACRYEMVRNPVDFMRRRTWIMLEEGNGIGYLDRIVELMGSELDWDTSIQKEMRDMTVDYIDKFIRIQPTEDVIPQEQLNELPLI